MLVETAAGLFCPAGGFHIDPWQPVARALITHAHGDHARPGSAAYLCATPCAPLLARRFGGTVEAGLRSVLSGLRPALRPEPSGHAHIECLAYGQPLSMIACV